MLNLYCKFKALLATRDQGITAVEYALILVGIVAVVATIVVAFGQQISSMFSTTCSQLKNGAAC
jgi:Flp pilus assembly pilin Flp